MSKRSCASVTVSGLSCGFFLCFWVRKTRSDLIEKRCQSDQQGRQLQCLGFFAGSLYALGSEIERSDSMKNEVSKW